jgi:hypothetical protein
MPTDLCLALASMISFSAALGLLAFRVARRSRRWGTIVALIAVLMLAAHASYLNDNPSLSSILPVSDLLIWLNLALPAACVLAGAVAALMRAPLWQRVLFPCLLIVIGFWRVASPLFGNPPPLGPDRWVDDVCRQSTTSSCSAAAAATLLRHFNIATNEAEMSQLCLTHANGTTNLGLYRGLSIKARSAGLNVIAARPTVAQLREWPKPLLVNIGLPSQSRWAVGGRHSIVLLDWNADTIDVADPFGGRQRWTWTELRNSYAGYAFAITK